MKHWSTVTDNAFNKAWKISCPTCVNSILWYKKQCHECETKTAADKKYTEEDILDSWELGAKNGLPLTQKKKKECFEQLKKN